MTEWTVTKRIFTWVVDRGPRPIGGSSDGVDEVGIGQRPRSPRRDAKCSVRRRTEGVVLGVAFQPPHGSEKSKADQTSPDSCGPPRQDGSRAFFAPLYREQSLNREEVLAFAVVFDLHEGGREAPFVGHRSKSVFVEGCLGAFAAGTLVRDGWVRARHGESMSKPRASSACAICALLRFSAHESAASLVVARHVARLPSWLSREETRRGSGCAAARVGAGQRGHARGLVDASSFDAS